MSIIEVSNISKKFKIQSLKNNSYLTLRESLSNVLKNPFDFARQKTSNLLNSNEEFWALKDINFTVEQGETIGIIGHNGAGKSTLLKILSQITPPTTGEIKINGRVASLLEVGTGFNPELSGRENIFLNAAILGMPKNEIKRKFDEIVDFAGVGKFIDTPVKRYSSGMQVRLAFSVAAHLEPEILLVDEVLAVGDAEFQKKCLGKMNEVTKQGGRTILFVSHNMGAIQNLCNQCILLQDGQIKTIGETNEVISKYILSDEMLTERIINNIQHVRGNNKAKINKVRIKKQNGQLNNSFLIEEPIHFEIDYQVEQTTNELSFWFILFNSTKTPIISSFQKDTKKLIPPLEIGSYQQKILFDNLGLLPGRYDVSIGIFEHESLSKWKFADWVDGAQSFTVQSAFFDGKKYDGRWGIVNKPAIWTTHL